VLTAVSFLGTLLAGATHWNTLGLPSTVRIGLGAPLLIGGMALSLWGVHMLSIHASLGLRGQLIRDGPYRYSRNPQYVGSLACLLGWAVLTSSPASLAACLGCGAWYVLAPFAEEPWLRNQFGVAYERYCEAIPRFLSWRMLRGRAAAS
jgi:protein-S-isoprenylcysteine O-methyltransferase Ste14